MVVVSIRYIRIVKISRYKTWNLRIHRETMYDCVIFEIFLLLLISHDDFPKQYCRYYSLVEPGRKRQINLLYHGKTFFCFSD